MPPRTTTTATKAREAGVQWRTKVSRRVSAPDLSNGDQSQSGEGCVMLTRSREGRWWGRCRPRTPLRRWSELAGEWWKLRERVLLRTIPMTVSLCLDLMIGLAPEPARMLLQQNCPGKIGYPQLSLTFCHNADAQGAGSKGGVVYTVGNGGIKWVIAWSNMQNDENKVYVDITDTAVDWSAVKSSLENSSPNPSAVTKNGYTTTATIDANKNLPSFTATLGTKPKPKPKPKGSLNYQIKVMGFGDALLTQGTLENNSNDGLSLSGFNDWSGSGTCPNVTPAKLSLTFCHNADAQGAGSKGGVVYTVGNGGIKWVIAWSNMQNDENKVYVDITDTAVDWSAVKSSLENSSPNPSAVTKNGYTTTATIDANKNLPSFTATLG
ncbi:hypothetical protein GQ457_14G021130 [Hibiscus cannabinus]